MAKKKSSKKNPQKAARAEPEKASPKQAAQKPEAPKKKKKVEVTPKLRRIWLRVRKAYGMSYQAFSNTISLLNEEEANLLYDLVICALFKGSVAEILRDHPEIRELVRNEGDRVCMHDCYEYLSWKLGKSEPLPAERKVVASFRKAVKGSIMP